MTPLIKLGVFAMVICLLFPASSVYGHGLGLERISSIDVQGKNLSVTVEMPMYFENEQEQLTITATDNTTNEPAKNVTFLIGLFHNDEMIFKKYFFTDNGILPIKIKPTQEENITIQGEQDSILGAWHGTESDPLVITGPLFVSGGLYTFEIEVRTIDEPTNIVENTGVYNADLTIERQLLSCKKIQKTMMFNSVSSLTLILFLIQIMILNQNNYHLKCHLIGMKNKCLT